MASDELKVSANSLRNEKASDELLIIANLLRNERI